MRLLKRSTRAIFRIIMLLQLRKNDKGSLTKKVLFEDCTRQHEAFHRSCNIEDSDIQGNDELIQELKSGGVTVLFFLRSSFVSLDFLDKVLTR